MEWEVVRINETSGKNVPFVSIGRGQLDFNAAACKLIGDEGQYKYARILKGKENGKTVIGVKFLMDADSDTILVKRKVQNGKIIQGMTVVNKGIIEELFGKDGSNDGMVRHKVELMDGNILKIKD